MPTLIPPQNYYWPAQIHGIPHWFKSLDVDISVIIERFIAHLFQCSTHLPPPAPPSFRLRHYIAEVLRLSKTTVNSPVLYGALVLLNRLRERYPKCRSSSGHQLFVPALMIASKYFDDHLELRIDHQGWTRIAQNSAPKRMINQMERELCSHLGWDFRMEDLLLRSFRKTMCFDFGRNNAGPMHKYPLHTTDKRPDGSTSTPSISAHAHPVQTISVGNPHRYCFCHHH